MADVVIELQDLIELAGTDPEAAIERFDRLVARHGRSTLAEALAVLAPEMVAETLAGHAPPQQ